MTPDLRVGEIRAVRTFDVGADGLLLPMVGSPLPWTDGVNSAVCRHEPHTPAAPGCHCGFWAYSSLRAAYGQPAARYLLAVVACWGRIVPATRGLRTQYARIEAVWVSRLVADDVVARLREHYPTVTFYRQRSAMLATHPTTVLDCYRPVSWLSVIRSWRRYAWRREWWRHAAWRNSSLHREH